MTKKIFLPKVAQLSQSHEKKGNDQQVKKVFIVKQILLISTMGNVWSKVERIWMLRLGFERIQCLVQCQSPLSPLTLSLPQSPQTDKPLIIINLSVSWVWQFLFGLKCYNNYYVQWMMFRDANL